jgi:tetratricopeptide (TPR) repeat protein
MGDEALVEQAYLDIRQHGRLRDGLRTARAVASRAKGSPALKARALHVLGHAQSRLRHPGKAIASLLESAAIYEELGDRRRLANVFDTLGTVYAARGRLQQALHHYSLSLVEKAVLDDRRGLAITIGNIGRLRIGHSILPTRRAGHPRA